MKTAQFVSEITQGRVLKALLVGTALVSLAGCGSGVKQALGIGKDAPDEFAIVTKAPLVIPPDFNLRPPQPGAPRPQTSTPSQQAENMMFGVGAQGAGQPLSAGEATLLQQAGAAQTDPDIRATVDAESAALVQKDQGFMSNVLSVGGTSAPGDEVLVDPVAEQERIATDPTAATPVIVPDDEGGWFDWLF